MRKTLFFAQPLSLTRPPPINRQHVVSLTPTQGSSPQIPQKRTRLTASSITPTPAQLSSLSTNAVASALASGALKTLPSLIARDLHSLSFDSVQQASTALTEACLYHEVVRIFDTSYQHVPLRKRFTGRFHTEMFFASMKLNTRVASKRAYQIFQRLVATDNDKKCMGPKAFNFLFVSLCRSLLLDESKIVRQRCAHNGFYLNRYSYNSSLNACAKTSRVEDAFHLFREMAENKIAPDVVSCNVLIACCVRSGEIDMALSILHRMHDWGLSADIYSFNSVINGFRKTSNLEEAFDLVASMEIAAGDEPIEGIQPSSVIFTENAVRPDLVTYNTLISGIAEHEKPDLDRALGVKHHMEKRGMQGNEVTFNALMATAARSNKLEEAFAIYDEMVAKKMNLTPNCECYTTLITLCGQTGQVDRAFQVHEQMVASGIAPNIVTFNALLTACRRGSPKHAAKIALDVLSLMRETPGCTPDVITYSTLIDTLGRDCRFEEMRALLEEMIAQGLKPNLITFTSMISAMARAGDLDGALQIISEMEAEGISPNVFTFLCLISGAGRRKDLDRCFQLIQMMHERNIQANNVTYAMLLQLSARSGRRKWLDRVIAEMRTDQRLAKNNYIEQLESILGHEDVLDMSSNSRILEKAHNVINEALGDTRYKR